MSGGTDERILRAAFELLQEHGLARLTVEAVVERAGVAKTTFYRRYRNAADVASAALAAAEPEPPAAPAAGGDGAANGTTDLRGTLLSFLAELGHRLETVGLDVLGAMLAEPEGELLARHRSRVVRPHRERLATIIAAAQERGEVRPDFDPYLAIEMLVGSFFSRHVAGRTMDVDEWATQAVDLLWRGVRPAG